MGSKSDWETISRTSDMLEALGIPHECTVVSAHRTPDWMADYAKTAVSPGIGFGDYGDHHVRVSLIENEERTRQALRGIKQLFAKGVLTAAIG